MSFFDWDMGTAWGEAKNVGWDNYVRMLWNDPSIWKSVWVTVKYTFWTTTLEMIVGIGLALALERPIRGAAFFRTIFILPLMMSPLIVGLIWRYMLDGRTGVFTYYIDQIGRAFPFLQEYGFVRTGYLAEVSTALPTAIGVDVWQWTPFIFIIILAGLQALPDVLRALEVLFIMTFGGPAASTEVLSLKIYKTAFESRDLGYASTISMLLISITLLLSLTILLYRNPTNQEEN